MWTWFPGYGLLGPAFWGSRSLIPGVAPVLPPGLPAGRPGGGPPPGPARVQAPAGENPLGALLHTPLAGALIDLLARVPPLAGPPAGQGAPAFPPAVPGMPRAPLPPPELFGGPRTQLGGPVRPVAVPEWFVAQAARLAAGAG